jgi:hypothetical protein
MKKIAKKIWKWFYHMDAYFSSDTPHMAAEVISMQV